MAGDGTCRHGQVPGGSSSIEVDGADERKVERHERRCRRARLFWHPTWLGLSRAVCCAGCGRRVL